MSTKDGAVISNDAIPIDPDAGGDGSVLDRNDTPPVISGSDASLANSIRPNSIREYRQIHGRTYPNFKTTEYWAPNDDQQNEHLDTGHQMLNVLLDGKLFLAPIGPNPEKVIDIGTGTGVWAIDFAEAFPSAQVIGTDLSPIQPTWVPDNVTFEFDDAELEWIHAENTFDFVHIRALHGGVGDWLALYKQAFKCLKPGGWIQDLEIDIMFQSDDGSVTDAHWLNDWSRLSISAGSKLGKSFENAQASRENMIRAGFVDVVEKKFKTPIGAWSSDPKMKEVGQWSRLYMEQGLEGMCLFLLHKVLGWQYEEVQAHIAKVRMELFDHKIHTYYYTYVVYGRKPPE